MKMKVWNEKNESLQIWLPKNLGGWLLLWHESALHAGWKRGAKGFFWMEKNLQRKKATIFDRFQHMIKKHMDLFWPTNIQLIQQIEPQRVQASHSLRQTVVWCFLCWRNYVPELWMGVFCNWASLTCHKCFMWLLSFSFQWYFSINTQLHNTIKDRCPLVVADTRNERRNWLKRISHPENRKNSGPSSTPRYFFIFWCGVTKKQHILYGFPFLLFLFLFWKSLTLDLLIKTDSICCYTIDLLCLESQTSLKRNDLWYWR